ncbi:MAG: FAD:protein FMN transferase, partial [Comamonas sp.]
MESYALLFGSTLSAGTVLALAALGLLINEKAGIINLGGNVFALGEKPSGKPWLVGIRDPNTRAGKSVATVEVRNRSVVTSG